MPLYISPASGGVLIEKAMMRAAILSIYILYKEISDDYGVSCNQINTWNGKINKDNIAKWAKKAM